MTNLVFQGFFSIIGLICVIIVLPAAGSSEGAFAEVGLVTGIVFTTTLMMNYMLIFTGHGRGIGSIVAFGKNKAVSSFYFLKS